MLLKALDDFLYSKHPQKQRIQMCEEAQNFVYLFLFLEVRHLKPVISSALFDKI